VDSAPAECSHSVWRVPGLVSLSARSSGFSLCRQEHSAGLDMFRTRVAAWASPAPELDPCLLLAVGSANSDHALCLTVLFSSSKGSILVRIFVDFGCGFL
jgi:hypothetical protein